MTSSRTRRFNPKRKLADAVSVAVDMGGAVVRYTGNPQHKRNPRDFGLDPPACPRTDKTLCDEAGVIDHAAAQALLARGLERGFVSQQSRNGFPQNIWSVDESGNAFEAQLENAEQGAYHGYPMPSNDPLRDEVLSRWAQPHE